MIVRKIFPACGLGLFVIPPSNSAMLNQVGGLCFIVFNSISFIYKFRRLTAQCLIR